MLVEVAIALNHKGNTSAAVAPSHPVGAVQDNFQEISHFHNVFKLMDVSWSLLLKPSDQPFHSPASFSVISIAGIHFAYISCC